VAPPPPVGPFAGASSVAVELGGPNRERGIKQVDHEDGRTAPAVAAGRPCRELRPGVRGERYLYFQVDDSFKWARTIDLVAEVEYFDSDGQGGSFTVQYDSHDPSATLDGAYKDCAERISLAGTGTWKTARFALHQARLEGSQNAGADFRIAVAAPEFRVGKVAVRRADGSGKKGILLR